MTGKLTLSDEMYARFRDLLQSRAGLFYPAHRREDLAHGLSQIIAAGGYESLEELYASAADKSAGWDALLSYLTIGETRFFRNEAHIQALRNHIFPNLIKQRSHIRTLRLWSAGCATGEEPYTMAMLLVDLLPDFEQWSITILATDINQHFLNRAREGLYSAWSFRETAEDVRQRFFRPEENRWRLNDQIRRTVHFMRLNLAETHYPSITNGTYALDLIICRNVTIYFERSTTIQVAERFYGALAPGGWLLVGHSEPQAEIYHQFETHNYPNAIVYRKSPDAPFFVIGAPPASTPQAPHARDSRPTTPAPPVQRPSAPEPPAQRAPTPAPRPVEPSSPPAAPRRPITSPLPIRQQAGLSPEEATWATIRTYLQRGDKANAVPLLGEFLQSYPHHTGALLAQGRVCADQGDWGNARRYCSQALEHDPMAAEAFYVLALVYEHEGNLEEALNAYRRTIYLNPDFILAILGMANVWRQMGRHDEARRSYRNLIKQLADVSDATPIPGTDDATASELLAFAERQLEVLS